MASWNGAARSNYFHVVDMEGLNKSLEPFAIEIREQPDGKVGLLSQETDSGSWPSFAYVSGEGEGDDEEKEIDFDIATQVMPFVKEGQVVVIMECGHEKLRYLTGWAKAFIRQGEEVKETAVSISDIYAKAAAEFGLPMSEITEATY